MNHFTFHESNGKVINVLSIEDRICDAKDALSHLQSQIVQDTIMREKFPCNFTSVRVQNDDGFIFVFGHYEMPFGKHYYTLDGILIPSNEGYMQISKSDFE